MRLSCKLATFSPVESTTFSRKIDQNRLDRYLARIEIYIVAADESLPEPPSPSLSSSSPHHLHES